MVGEDIKLKFGKHKGEQLKDVPYTYLTWCLRVDALKGKAKLYAQLKTNAVENDYTVVVSGAVIGDGIYKVKAYNTTHAINVVKRTYTIQNTQSHHGTDYHVTKEKKTIVNNNNKQMEDKFKNFEIIEKRMKASSDSDVHIKITSAYISFAPKSLSILNAKQGDHVKIAIVTNETKLSQSLLLAKAADKTGYEIIVKEKLKVSPIIYSGLGKKHPEIKGDYYLKPYGVHEDLTWFEVTKERPEPVKPKNKIKFF